VGIGGIESDSRECLPNKKKNIPLPNLHYPPKKLHGFGHIYLHFARNKPNGYEKRVSLVVYGCRLGMKSYTVICYMGMIS